MSVVREGGAEIEVREGVFYNPKMKGLRDISTALLKAMKIRDVNLLDSTSATGVRGIRYALETQMMGKLTLLDVNRGAYLNTMANLKRNRIDAEVFNMSIKDFSRSSNAGFDVIDLDPFGTPAPYMNDLMRFAKDNTLFMVTATDTAVLCGANAGACARRYGSSPLHTELCHEVGARILIDYICRIAKQYSLGIEVKLAISNLHYMRVFVVLRRGQECIASSYRERGGGVYCRRCHLFRCTKGSVPEPASLKGKCENCNNNLDVFGPLWLGNLYDKRVLGSMAQQADESFEKNAMKLVGLLYEELDTPLFYSIPKLTKYLGISSVSPRLVMEELRKNHEVTGTHFNIYGVKTDASIYDVFGAIKSLSKA